MKLQTAASTLLLMLVRASHHVAQADEVETKIVGGTPVNDPDMFPFYARLDVNDNFTCGGSLIWPDVILTAAHCVEPLLGQPSDPSAYNIAVGATQQVGSGENFKVLETMQHPSWNPGQGLGSDYALVLLDGKSSNPTMELNDMADVPVNGEPLTVIGMGRQYNQGPVPGELLMAPVEHLGHDSCRQEFPFWLRWILQEDNMICAAGENESGERTDACNGDSGGPLFIETGRSPIQVGVVSWGRGCGDEGSPGVYARVSEAVPWIRQFICSRSSVPPSQEDFCSDAPLPVPTCQDDANAEFTWREEDQTCEWLRSNPFRTGWVCLWSAEARDACEETCGQCN